MDERKIKVIRVNQITPNMRRITFSAENLKNFPTDQIGGYVKLIFKKSLSDKKFVRPYTIRDFRDKKLELDLDFALHKNNLGLASSWAFKAKVGDEIYISGPKGKKSMVDYNSDWFFLVGDMSSLPAISVNIETLPQKAFGVAIIEILSESDKQVIRKPKNFEIKWIVNSKPHVRNKCLINEVSSFKWYDGNPYIWVACEFNNMKVLRNFFCNENGVKKNQIYISSYWKVGSNQENHKIIKKEDSIRFIEMSV